MRTSYPPLVSTETLVNETISAVCALELFVGAIDHVEQLCNELDRFDPAEGSAVDAMQSMDNVLGMLEGLYESVVSVKERVDTLCKGVTDNAYS